MHNLLTAIEIGKRNNEPTLELVAVLNYVNCNAENSCFVPVFHGHWITDEDWDAYCSVCGDRWGGNIDTDLFKYCPHCGALMDESVPLPDSDDIYGEKVTE